MTTPVLALTAAIAMFAVAMPAAADIKTLSLLQVYFTRDDKPFEKPVEFAVACRGWRTWPGRSSPAPTEPRKVVEVYRFSAKCPTYGCEIHHSLQISEYRHIVSCDASGTAGGKAFRIRDFGTSPIGDCPEASRGLWTRRCTLRLALPK